MLSVFGVSGNCTARGVDWSSVLLADGGVNDTGCRKKDDGRKKGTSGVSLLSVSTGCTKNLRSGSNWCVFMSAMPPKACFNAGILKSL